MIHLTVTTFNSKPVSHLAGSFDELGGTIGRAPNNQLVLPDPERVVSRVHAKVVFRGGSYALVAYGGNALIHNGKMVEHGAEVRLTPGDSIEMGGYHLVVGAPESLQTSDPFADMFGTQEQGSQPAPRHASNPPAARPPSTGSAVRAAPAGGGPAIPEDWDPFGGASRIEHGMPGARAPGAAPSAMPVPRARREDSLDELFGLDSSLADEPFKKGPLAQPAARPNTRAHADPLRSLQEAPPPVAGAQPDHVSDLHAPWSNVGGMKAAPGPTPPTDGAVYSWRSQAGGTPASKPPQQPHPARAKPRGTQRPRDSQADQTVSPRQHASISQSADDLLPALLEGLGVPDLPVDRLTPALMYEVGQILRESTKGTLDLLAIRTALKREIRAGVTIIKPRQNNSLKFSPSVDVALRHMLAPARGFMPPVESVRDAFEDLRAHELAVMVGMKAALAGVLERFDPAVLEKKLASGSPLAGLIPSARKAKLWDLFEMLYKKLAAEAVDDFDTLFGKAFLKAYEQCLEQLSDTPARD